MKLTDLNDLLIACNNIMFFKTKHKLALTKWKHLYREWLILNIVQILNIYS